MDLNNKKKITRELGPLPPSSLAQDHRLVTKDNLRFSIVTHYQRLICSSTSTQSRTNTIGWLLCLPIPLTTYHIMSCSYRCKQDPFLPNKVNSRLWRIWTSPSVGEDDPLSPNTWHEKPLLAYGIPFFYMFYKVSTSTHIASDYPRMC